MLLYQVHEREGSRYSLIMVSFSYCCIPGSGKTTQVPQFVLEDATDKGTACNIIIAQPRRISAMSVAERVAAERGEEVGKTVGYTIRLESKAMANTRLLFCTTGKSLSCVLHLCAEEL